MGTLLLGLVVFRTWMFYSWTPNRHAVKALGLAIRSHFEGPYHHYEAVPEDVQVRWWTEFKVTIYVTSYVFIYIFAFILWCNWQTFSLLLQTRVTWTAQDEWQIKKVYETKVKKRLSDMLTKARDKRKRPHWIAWFCITCAELPYQWSIVVIGRN